MVPFARAAAELIERYALIPGDLVIEVGCGDGSLLQAIRTHGPRVLGIEPGTDRIHQVFHADIDILAVPLTDGTADFISHRHGYFKLLLLPAFHFLDEDLQPSLRSARLCSLPNAVIAEHIEGDILRELSLGQSRSIRRSA